jgi:aquaporin Z
LIEHLRRFGTELAATCTFCLIVMLTAAGTAAGDAGRIATAFASGLGLLAAIQFFGAHAPVHVNPAVTLAIFMTGRGSLLRLLACVAGQLLGGCLAGLAAMWLLGGTGTAMGMPVGSFTKADAAKTVVVEGFLTLVWAGVHLSAAASGRTAVAPLAVGLAVVAATLAGLPYTGAALNPARGLAAAVATLDFSTLWLYVAGPLAGAAVAGMLGRFFWAENSGPATEKKG